MPTVGLNPNNPHDLAVIAAQKRLGKPITPEFLTALYSERGMSYNECELASFTYMNWHESVTKSGISFNEHLRDVGFRQSCTLIPEIQADYRGHKSDVEAQNRALALRSAMILEEEEKQNKATMIFIGTGVAALGIGALFFILERRKRNG